MTTKAPDLNSLAVQKQGFEDFIIFRFKGKQYAAFLPTAYGLVKRGNCSGPTLPLRDKLTHQTLQFLFGDAKTMAQVKQYWDFFACAEQELVQADALGDVLIAGNTKVEYQRVTSSGARLASSGVTMIDFDPDDVLTPEQWKERSEKANVRFVDLPHIGEKAKPTEPELSGYSVIIEGQAIQLPAKITPFVKNMPAKHTNFLQYGWECSDFFAKCFPLLSENVDAHPTYDWNELSDLLKSQLEQDQGKVEIFGIKPPAAEESYWGICAILAVLIYFWLHLRQLSLQIRGDHTGLDVPWVGLYRSFPPLCFVWCSVLLVPLVAVVALGLRAIHWDPHTAFSDRRIFSLVAPSSALCCFLGVSSCLKMWRLARIATEADEKETSSAELKNTAAKVSSSSEAD